MGKLREVEPEEVDEAEAKRQRKAARRAARETAAVADGAVVPMTESKSKKGVEMEEAVAEEADEVEAKRQRKAARKAAKEAAASAAVAAAEELDEADAEEAKRQRKLAKKTAKEAAAAAEAAAAGGEELVTKKTGKRATEAISSDPIAKKPKQAKIEDDDLEVFVGGIAFDCDEAALRAHFGECGGVGQFSMPLDAEWNAKGIAFITFTDKAGVDAALKLDNTKFMERNLKVRLSSAAPTKGAGKDGKADDSDTLEIFVGGIPWNVDEATFRKDFEECGEVVNIHMPMSDGRPKGIAFVKYKTKDGVDAAMKFDGTNYGGRPLQVRLSSTKSTKGQGKGAWTARNDKHTAFVIGLPFTVDQSSVRKHFDDCGKIERLVLPSDENGVSKGVAFVQFSDDDGMVNAIKLNDTNFGGRYIKVRKYDGPGQGSKGQGDKEGKGKGDKESKGKAKGKGKTGKGKADKGEAGNHGPAEWARSSKYTGALAESTGTKQVFADSDED